ncbi:MAG: lipoprotein [Proteobacteria bacterium]|nr:lipoprotein [Pseudomonadota bacterium]
MRVLMAAAACALLLSACGIKGPLHLPPTNPAATHASPTNASPTAAPPADADSPATDASE